MVLDINYCSNTLVNKVLLATGVAGALTSDSIDQKKSGLVKYIQYQFSQMIENIILVSSCTGKVTIEDKT